MEQIKRLNAYQEALEVDNFLEVLSVTQRMAVHQFRNGYLKKVPKKVSELQQWAENNGWQNKDFRYSQERFLLWHNNETGQWQQVFKQNLKELSNN